MHFVSNSCSLPQKHSTIDTMVECFFCTPKPLKSIDYIAFFMAYFIFSFAGCNKKFRLPGAETDFALHSTNGSSMGVHPTNGNNSKMHPVCVLDKRKFKSTGVVYRFMVSTIQENAHVTLNQTEYQNRYNALVERFDKAKGGLTRLMRRYATIRIGR